MLLSHLREYEHRVGYLEHEAYINNLRYSSCRKVKVKLVKEGLRQRREITGLSQENDQLRMEKDEMAEDLRQTRNYFRAAAFEATGFLERKR
jgi:predicted RecB family nuclease